jgi:hypothetical protein
MRRTLRSLAVAVLAVGALVLTAPAASAQILGGLGGLGQGNPLSAVGGILSPLAKLGNLGG